MPKKAIPFLVAFISTSSLLLFLCPTPTKAQIIEQAILNAIYAWIDSQNQIECVGASTQWWNPDGCTFRKKVFNSPEQEIFGERYTYAQVTWIIHSLISIITTTDNGDSLKAIVRLFACAISGYPLNDECPLSYTPDHLRNDLAKSGLPGLALALIHTTISTPPASGVDSFNSTLAKINPIPTAYAQGYGYTSMLGIQNLWAASRNMAYLVLVVLIIVSGFMIMFRVKINPQTAVTIQLMIPKIILTLILITFSYAIAGFLIDLSYVLVAFVISLLGTQGVLNPTVAIQSFTENGFSMMALYLLLPFLLIALIGLVAAGLLSFTGIGPLPGVITAIIMAIFIIVLFLLLIRVWFMLFKSYVTLLILIIISPWQIMLGVLPNPPGGGFAGWLRNVIANISPFVVVSVMFLVVMLVGAWPPIINFIGDLLRNAYIGTTRPQVNPLDPGNMPSLPLFGSQGLLFTLVLPLIILALIPKVADIIKDILKQPQLKYGAAFGEVIDDASFAAREARQTALYMFNKLRNRPSTQSSQPSSGQYHTTPPGSMGYTGSGGPSPSTPPSYPSYRPGGSSSTPATPASSGVIEGEYRVVSQRQLPEPKDKT